MDGPRPPAHGVRARARARVRHATVRRQIRTVQPWPAADIATGQRKRRLACGGRLSVTKVVSLCRTTVGMAAASAVRSPLAHRPRQPRQVSGIREDPADVPLDRRSGAWRPLCAAEHSSEAPHVRTGGDQGGSRRRGGVEASWASARLAATRQTLAEQRQFRAYAGGRSDRRSGGTAPWSTARDLGSRPQLAGSFPQGSTRLAAHSPPLPLRTVRALGGRAGPGRGWRVSAVNAQG